MQFHILHDLLLTNAQRLLLILVMVVTLIYLFTLFFLLTRRIIYANIKVMHLDSKQNYLGGIKH